MLTVLTWRWGTKYSDDHAIKLYRGVQRNLTMRHRFIMMTDKLAPNLPFEQMPMTRMDLLKVNDGCYVRLQMFDREWRHTRGFDTIFNLDLDLVITRQIDPLIVDGKFMILHGGHFNPCPFNGSVMLIRDGAPENVWKDFNIEDAEKNATADGTHRGTDQTWIAYKAPNAAGWTYRDGIYAYGKPGWPKDDALPANARIVAFPGKADPSKMMYVPWIKENWR